MVSGAAGLHRRTIHRALLKVEVDADDVRLAGGDRQHAFATAADQDRDRLLHRLRRALVVDDCVVRAAEIHRAIGEQPLDDRQAFFEAADPHAGAVVDHAGCVVVRAHPPRAQPELHPPAGKHIDGRCLLGVHQRMLVVVVQHQSAHAQRCRRGRSGHHRRHRRQLIAEMIRDQQGRVPEALDPTRLLGPLLARAPAGRLHAEPELLLCHRCFSFVSGIFPAWATP